MGGAAPSLLWELPDPHSSYRSLLYEEIAIAACHHSLCDASFTLPTKSYLENLQRCQDVQDEAFEYLEKPNPWKNPTLGTRNHLSNFRSVSRAMNRHETRPTPPTQPPTPHSFPLQPFFSSVVTNP